MKQLTKQTSKWALSALLFAALGSQYYFSSYSNHQGSVELASEDDPSDMTEARTVFCDGCTSEGITFKGPNALKESEKFLKLLEAKKAVGTRVVVAAAAPAKVETEAERDARIAKEKEAQIIADCKYKDTSAERARCQREARADARKEEKEAKEEAKRLAKEEKDAKKKEIADAKAEKLKDAKEKRNDSFEIEVEKIANNCKNEDFGCFSNEFTALLSQFTGDKGIDSSVINKAYTKYLDKDLKAALRGSPEARQQALAVIESITGDLPKEHRIVKEKTIDALKAATISRGVEVNDKFRSADQMYKMAEQLAKSGRAAESLQYFEEAARLRDYEAPKAKAEFLADANIYGQTVVRNLEKSSDATTLSYFNTNFMPDVKKIMANLQNVSGIDLSTLGSSTSRTINPIGTTGSRGGRISSVSNGVAQSGNITNGVDFGTASKTSTSTKRGGK